MRLLNYVKKLEKFGKIWYNIVNVLCKRRFFMNYFNDTNKQPQYMNRAERRKNKIKTEKMPECKYTREELRAFFEKELNELRKETCSEAIKRERYQRLRKLVEEYEKQNGKSSVKSESRNLENSQDERVKAYVRQKEGLASNPVYQNLHSSNTKSRTQNEKVRKSRTMREAIQAYETQTAYTTMYSAQYMKRSQTASTAKNTAKSNKKAMKKGFFTRILDLFKPKKSAKGTVAKPNICGVKTASKPVRYYDKIVEQSKEITKNVYNDFEKALRDMQNYSKETNCRTVINGRKVNLEPRYL